MMEHLGTVLHCTNFITTKTSNFEVLISEISLYDRNVSFFDHGINTMEKRAPIKFCAHKDKGRR
jgi:hypothetical protein